MHDQHLHGGHRLPAEFSSAPAVRARPRRRRLLIILAGAVVVAGCAGIHLAANLGYDDALVAFEDATATTGHRQDDLADELAALQADADAAGQVTAADSGILMPAEARASLDTAVADVQPVATEADAAATAALGAADPKPTWTWELFADTAQLGDDTHEMQQQTDDIADLRDDVQEASEGVEDSTLAAIDAAAVAAADLETAHVNARNPEIIAVRAAAAPLVSATTLDAATVARYAELETATAAMLESERAELAEKDGPLRDRRVEIEAFARSLVPGLLLDFDWGPTVPGYDGPSSGGWTTWWYGDPGYATIALSDYIAESWPAAWAEALVAHEVGHAVSVRCEAAYDSSDQDTIEEWATAWAISRGYADRGNGTDVYGAPSPAMIDAASDCR